MKTKAFYNILLKKRNANAFNNRHNFKTIALIFIMTLGIFNLCAQELRISQNSNNDVLIEPIDSGINTFLGVQAGKVNVGLNNTFIGGYAGMKNTLGQSNSFIGLLSGADNISGSSNIFIGNYSGRENTIGEFNTFIGNFSGNKNIDGSLNVFLGIGSGFNNINGSKNTFFGNYTGYNNNGSGNLFLGNEAGANEVGSNKLYISNTNTTDPLIYGEFDNKLLRFNTENLELGNIRIRKNDTTSQHAMIEPLNTDGGVFLGENAGRKNLGENNTFIGSATGFSNITGGSNTFIGKSAGYSNIWGYSNTFLGSFAGASNTTGATNTFIGGRAGFSNTIGYDNTFIGRSAGDSNIIGFQNTFIGRNAGNKNTTANYNTIIGSYAGNANTTGFDNTFLGQAAGNLNTTGSLNTFLGRNAGANNTTANDNTMVGVGAGFGNTTGFANTFLGVSAGNRNLDGDQNTYIGTDAGFNNINGNRNVFIGNQAGMNETGSNKLYISNSNAGEGDALIYGDFNDKELRFNAKVGIGEGSPDGQLHITSNEDATLIIEADNDNVNESDNPGLEYRQDGGITKARSGFDNDEYGSNAFAMADLGVSALMIMKPNGDVGIGVEPQTVTQIGQPGYQFVSGSKLSVRGRISASEFHVVSLAAWPDYVFEDDYELMPLEEVEASIEKNGHLPGIASATEIEENGLKLGAMQVKMMEKIEELTLHLIEMNKKIAAQEAEIKALKANKK